MRNKQVDDSKVIGSSFLFINPCWVTSLTTAASLVCLFLLLLRVRGLMVLLVLLLFLSVCGRYSSLSLCVCMFLVSFSFVSSFSLSLSLCLVHVSRINEQRTTVGDVGVDIADAVQQQHQTQPRREYRTHEPVAAVGLPLHRTQPSFHLGQQPDQRHASA